MRSVSLLAVRQKFKIVASFQKGFAGGHLWGHYQVRSTVAALRSIETIVGFLY